jgi:hypothetical protein
MSRVAHFHFSPKEGTVPTEGKKTVVCTFKPKNLGEFSRAVSISICNGLSRRHVNILGISLQSGDVMQPFERKPLWEVDESARYLALHPDERYGFSTRELTAIKAKRDVFDGYLTDAAKRRDHLTKEQELRERVTRDVFRERGFSEETQIDEHLDSVIRLRMKEKREELELEPTDQLVPPNPKCLKVNNNLVVPDPERLGLISSVPEQSKRQPTANSQTQAPAQFHRIFKPLPTTPPEINECQRELTPSQLLYVSASHQTVHFGSITVFTTETKIFTVKNGLEQYILVEVPFDAEELSGSHPKSQVVPPGQVAGFSVAFRSNSEMNFVKSFNYRVNRIHKFMLTISAHVIPIEIQLARPTIAFRFAIDSTEPTCRETLVMRNPSTSPAEFSWTGFTGSIFSINTERGRIEPGGSCTVEIRYVPGPISQSEQVAELSVVGGPSRKLRLIGDAGSPKFRISKRAINFGLMPIGIQRTASLRVRNVGKDDGLFSVKVSDPSFVQVNPSNGRISVGSTRTFQVSGICDTARQFEATIGIDVAGGPSVSLAVSDRESFQK